MARRKPPVSAAAIQRELRKAYARLSAMRKKKLPAERKVIDLEMKTLKRCERLLKNLQFI